MFTIVGPNLVKLKLYKIPTLAGTLSLTLTLILTSTSTFTLTLTSTSALTLTLTHCLPHPRKSSHS